MRLRVATMFGRSIVTFTGRMTTNGLTLVLGATGKTGSRVAALLTARGEPVRTGSRAADPPFEWNDRSTWDAALEGVSAAYVAFAPDLAVPGAAETVESFTKTASAAGVRRLVLLSGRGEPEAQATEERVLTMGGFDATVVRASWFAQNFSESFLLDAVHSGVVALPLDPAVREPFIDADDIAAVAVAALIEPGHAGRIHEVTGPRAMTMGEAVAEVAAASGQELSFVSVPLADYTAALTAPGLGDDLVTFFAYLFTEVMDGSNASTTDGVQQVLGRPARDFTDYARHAAATGVWSS